MTRPNIVYLHSHDTGRYIQPYGHAIHTPNLQRLAEEGVLFRQTFCAGPTCSPSRAGLLTGQSAHAAGMLGLAHRGFKLNDPTQHLATTLARAGYQTVLCGVQHVHSFTGPGVGSAAAACGYQLTRGDRKIETEDFAVEYVKSKPTQPFFLDAGWIETHRFGNVNGFSSNTDSPKDGEADARYVLPPPPLPDTPQTRRDMADYKVSATRLDRKMGMVLAALREAGLEDNTLIIATTDHGIAFPAMKCSLTDNGIGVMLLMRGPGGFAGGKVVDAMISQIDVFATLCDYLKLDRPAWLTGKSFMPVVAGDAAEIHDAIFSEVTFHAAYEPKRAVRTKRYKYIRNYDPRRRPVLPDCDDSPSKALWMDHGWGGHAIESEELYDLMFDPHEKANLAGVAAHASTLGEMRQRLDTWMRQTRDPLLDPAFPWSDQLKVNDPDGISPSEPTTMWKPATGNR